MTALQEPRQQTAQLRTEAQEAYSALQRQQEILQLRNITFQPGLLSILDTLAAGLDLVERSMREDETELTQLRVLAETSALINSSFDLDTVLASAMDSVLRLSGAGRGYILLLNEAGTLEFRVTRTREPDDDGEESVSRTILHEVLESGKPLLTDNAAHDPRISTSTTVAKYTLRSVMSVPLIFKDQIEGAIYVDNRYREGVFSERELNLLVVFANQVAIAIENARLFASVQSTLREIMQATDLMENIFASIESGVITADARDSITIYNHAAAKILNKPYDVAIGQPLRAVLPPIRPDFEEALAAAQTHNISSALETETEVPGRPRIALSLKISPLKNDQAQTEGVTMVLDDLTEQLEHNETLDLLRRYLPPGMVENIHEIAQLDLGGERREVTCMFVDAGLVAQVAGKQPRDLMQMLNMYLEAITSIVHQGGGLIDKYIGSEVMALFNTQLNPQRDHALRATETALELRQAFTALDHQHGFNPDVRRFRIGIHTGVATLGNVGGIQRRSFTALGDAINLAKRLQEISSNGQIIMSDDTLRAWHSATHQFGWRELNPVQVKGRKQLTRIYEVYPS
jgi:class 3 adenylate cyclase